MKIFWMAAEIMCSYIEIEGHLEICIMVKFSRDFSFIIWAVATENEEVWKVNMKLSVASHKSK